MKKGLYCKVLAVGIIVMLVGVSVLPGISSLHIKNEEIFLQKSVLNNNLDIHPQERTDWNAVILFFNLDLPSGDLPGGYVETTILDVLEFLDEGPNPAEISISEFMSRYWKTISYGNLDFGGVDTPRDPDGGPLIPLLVINPYDWGGIIRACIDANAEEVWEAAGGLLKDGKRWIPAVVLVQHYWVGATAGFFGFDQVVSGETYYIGDVHHIPYNLAFTDFLDTPEYPDNYGREIWGTICHEFGHNFMEIWDLYGPQGCTGYWDLLGSNAASGRMSEIFSLFKEHNGWLSYKDIVVGPVYPETVFSLNPYTTTGEAIKVVPDPINNPGEYFLLEYRGSTGSELWRPDGGLPEEGLCIIHVNERLGIPLMWMMREAPFFDVEFADFSDNGSTMWTGHDKLNGVLYPEPGQESFTPYTNPNSDFYGGRSSGLYISDISVIDGQCNFSIKIEGNPTVGWVSSNDDRCIAGYFTPESLVKGEEIFIRNNFKAALLTYEQGQWLVKAKHDNRIGDWTLGSYDYEVVGDFDGDGLDEIYIRSLRYSGVLKWDDTIDKFKTLGVPTRLSSMLRSVSSYLTFIPALVVILSELILDPFLADHREFAADIDGDGRDEIIMCGPKYLGFYDFTTSYQFDLKALHWNRIDSWTLGNDNSRYVGRFMATDRDELLIRSPEYLGLFTYHTGMGIWQVSMQYDWVDSWDLIIDDQHTIGDFEGDGIDEIFIHTSNKAGVMKFNYSTMNFKLLWGRDYNIEPKDDRLDRVNYVHLSPQDISYSGRFLREPDKPRDGILLRNGTSVSVLTWNVTVQYTGMRVQQQLSFPCSGGLYYYPIAQWYLDPNDIFVLGDFHRKGSDIAIPEVDHVGDNITDIFIFHPYLQGSVDACPYSTTIGVNYVYFDPPEGISGIHEEIGLIWYNYVDESSNEFFMMLN
jgi:hypothetical protein